ncbi:MAG: 2-polyprenyl-6-methoxyphenol hydroxylase-like oxidoreductase [Proteobacteria bacterium]|nr:2-polyprenyl-6-methoxyphenol hydroxylase-like oxidoreductase [Pseudomonadota bacterium]
MNRHAIVIGGSLAGLCAARALSRFFEHVTVLERDALPVDTHCRRGVPQARHVHALLARGRTELERLLPGFTARLREAGALEHDMARDFAVLRPYGWAPREESGIPSLFASRELVEATVRGMLAEHSNVSFEDRSDVAGLRVDPYGSGRITGVVLENGARDVFADLVVDASGARSPAPRWLREAGLAVPEETRVDSFCSYSTRWYEAPPPEERPDGWWWKGIWIDPRPGCEKRAAVLFPAEGGRWIVTLVGLARMPPPTTEAGFVEALGRLPSPLVAQAVNLAKPVSPVYGSRSTVNRLRHYERVRWPLQGFLALGDAVCSFNPLYGQGMTAAAVCARILERQLELLAPGHPELSVRFFQAQSDFMSGPWRLATSADFRFAETEGQRPAFSEWRTRYMDALIAASGDDPALRAVIAEVVHMLCPPERLFAADVVVRVLRQHMRRRLGGMPPFAAASAAAPRLAAR